MAPGWIHKLDAEIFGYSNMVNIILDFPVRWLGPRHRILHHTLDEAMFIGFLIDGPRGVFGAIRHLMLDGVLTGYDYQRLDNMFRKALELRFEVLLLELEIQKLKQKMEQEGTLKQKYKILSTPQTKRTFKVLSITPVKKR